MIYDELNRFTGSLTCSIWRFIFYAMAQGERDGTMIFPPLGSSIKKVFTSTYGARSTGLKAFQKHHMERSIII